MKKLLLILFLTITALTSFGQTAKEMLAEIEGKWEIDNNNNVTFTRVIDAPGVSKEDLYLRALSYFTYNYNSGDAVVQVEDKDDGVIVGKGIYPKVHTGITIVTSVIDTYHILRVDIRDEKIRVMVTLTEYKTTMYGTGQPSVSKCDIGSRYPIAEKDFQKTTMSKAFYKSYLAATSSLDSIEKAIKEGNTGAEANEW